MTYNAAERKDVRKAEKAAAIAEREAGEIISELMSAAPGRAWILTKLESANIFSTTFSTDPCQMAFNEGQRNQGLLLLTDIMRHCPDQYVLMMRERNEKEQRNGERSNPSNTNALSERSSSEDGDGGDSESGDSSSGPSIYDYEGRN